MPDNSNHLPLRFALASGRKAAVRKEKPVAPRRTRGAIAQIKVTLQHIRPQIWRRLEVPTNLSLGALHDILQIAFGWTNPPLHQFHNGSHRFGIIDDESDDDTSDENEARLDQLLPAYEQFLYEYDFGDSWMH